MATYRYKPVIYPENRNKRDCPFQPGSMVPIWELMPEKVVDADYTGDFTFAVSFHRKPLEVSN